MFSLQGKRIWVAGETGLVGRALVRALSGTHAEIISASHAKLDLTDQRATLSWLREHKPDAVFMAAGRVGGIGANASNPAGFIRDNLAMAGNVIEGAHRAGVQHLLYLGSSCIYPKNAGQPIREEDLMSGALEPTNEAYAVAKIAGVKLCEFYSRQYGRRYMAALPTNLYGPFDRFDAQGGHVIPAMMLKFHAAINRGAASVTLWGTGAPLREFLHVDDLAQALILMMERGNGNAPVNIGSGEEVPIARLAEVMKEITGFKGEIIFDATHPDGTPRKLLDSSKIKAMGWAPSIGLEEGLSRTYEWYYGKVCA